MKVAILNYGAGNLHSIGKAISAAGAEPVIVTDAAGALAYEALVLPGVGAFASAAASIRPSVPLLRDALRSGFPCVGVCLGMQLLFDRSQEGDGEGLGIIPGSVRRLRASRIPQIGWNTVEPIGDSAALFDGLDYAYYANGFVCEPEDGDSVIARTTYEADEFPAAVRRYRTVGVQFHPEKSSQAGIALIARLLAEVMS